MTYLLLFLLLLLAFFLIVLVLIQRGKGGGLAGAFGGMGGQSAFGTKAGDLFTRITIGVAFVWILVCIASVKYIGATGNRLNLNNTVPANSGNPNPGGGAPSPGADPTKPSAEAPASTAEKPVEAEKPEPAAPKPAQ
ncbi:MAG: preprotein translocase subunit SecG [Pirellulales bacterium]|nr:preprotein translocase subunit SecG [Pirellulales bacterium]